MRLFYDIETEADPQRVEVVTKPFGDFDPESVKTGNLKDPNKIKEKIAAAEAQHEKDRDAYHAEALDKGALSPATGRILTIQYAIDDDPVTVITSATDSEETVIKAFLATARPVLKWINWTGSNKSGNFDMNFLIRRAWYHGIRVEYAEVIDLAQKFLRHADWGTYYSLENAVLEMGGTTIDTPVTGATFAEYYHRGGDDRSLALDYARADVQYLQFLAGKIL